MDNPRINDNGKSITLIVNDQAVTFDDWGQLAQLAVFLIRNVPLQNFITPKEWQTFKTIYFGNETR